MTTLERAIRIAVEAHEGKEDKAGAPYILHPLRVMLRMGSETERIAAVLHDVIEDTRWTADDLRKAGFLEDVVNVVVCLTRKKEVDPLTGKKKEPYGAYIKRVMLDPTATKIKLADLEDNMDMRRIEKPTTEDWKRLKKYHGAWLKLRDRKDR
jgi:(p)ppGpp synthase/HD superfamily hydrolase